ncbi:hypothetical protein EV2_001707 [Malus domestica]
MGDWAMSLAEHLSPPDFDLFVMLCWAIWEARNSRLWNDKLEAPNFLASRITSLWLEFVLTNSHPTQILQSG